MLLFVCGPSAGSKVTQAASTAGSEKDVERDTPDGTHTTLGIGMVESGLESSKIKKLDWFIQWEHDN